MRPREILEACVYAPDLEAAERFYTGVLGLPVHARVAGRHVFFRCGGRMFLVFDPAATGTGMAPHGATGPGHVCFAVAPEDIPAWRDRLREQSVDIEAEHTWPGGGLSLYFRDPAGNSVELGTPAIWHIPDAEALGHLP